jgi:hypothetical protein
VVARTAQPDLGASGAPWVPAPISGRNNLQQRTSWGSAVTDTVGTTGQAVAISSPAAERWRRDAGAQLTERSPASALVWPAFVLNGLVFAEGAVSTPVSVQEVAVLAVGLAVMPEVNAVLLRARLRPLGGSPR